MGNIETGDALAGRFELGEVLGSGGMADVRRAHDLLLDRPVAVKVLRDTVDETERNRFMAEARTLAQLSHVGLVTVLDAGTGDGQPYLVMELVEGRTLGDALRQGPLPGPEVARIGAQVADALGYAHDQGVVHRDVKPGNVLIGQDGQVKLADFGIARLIGDTVRQTKTGMTIGTPAYLSPEQVRADPVGPASDVYSLGLVLLEALTGERTFRGSPTEAAVARLHAPPPVPEDLPPGWRDLFLAMTAPDPAARPSACDAAEVLRELAALGGDDGSAADATAVTRLVGDRVAPPAEARMPAAGPPPVVPPGSAEEAAIRTAQRRVPARRVPTRRSAGTVTAVAVGCLLLVLAVLGVVLTRSGGGSGDEVPAQTPSRLREPLQDLHDAVHGEAR